MGGMTYTMTDTTKLSTAECYGIALCELGEEHKSRPLLPSSKASCLPHSFVILLQPPQRLVSGNYQHR